MRPVSFKYRSKRLNPAWRAGWDRALFVGSSVPALIFGVAVGNTLRGVPFHYTSDLRPIYEGTLFGMLNPVALYCGLVSLSMLIMHGAAWLALKSEGPVADRSRSLGAKAALLAGVLFAASNGPFSPTAGAGFQLPVIAAVILAGVSLSGGRGSIWGTALGLFMIMTLNNGLDILVVPAYWQDVIKGVLIVAAVAVDVWSSRRRT